MSKKNILLAITNGLWLIQPEFAHASAGLVHKLLSGEQVFTSKEENEDDQLSVGCFTISPEGSVSFGSRRDPFQNASPGSTAVIGISGPILKYDNCGDPGTKTYSALLNAAKGNYNISSVLLVIDSPGGTVDGTQDLAKDVKNFTKPIVAFVDGLMASAAYWIGSSANEVIANNETAMIGSIGTMISFADMQPMWEKEGVKFHTILADASFDKNKDFTEARKGNYDLLKEKLNTINDVFVSSVKENRANIKSTALSGKVFMAENAIEQGLIDAIGDFEYAVARAQALAASSTANSNQNSQKQNMKTIKLTAAHAMLLALCGASIAAGENSVDIELNDELVNKINSSLEESKIANAEIAKKLEAKEAELATAKTDLSKTEADFKTFKESNPGATSTFTTKEDVIEGAKEDFTTEEDRKLAKTYDAIHGEGSFAKAVEASK